LFILSVATLGILPFLLYLRKIKKKRAARSSAGNPMAMPHIVQPQMNFSPIHAAAGSPELG
jgi:hypothetical protein